MTLRVNPFCVCVALIVSVETLSLAGCGSSPSIDGLYLLDAKATTPGGLPPNSQPQDFTIALKDGTFTMLPIRVSGSFSVTGDTLELLPSKGEGYDVLFMLDKGRAPTASDSRVLKLRIESRNTIAWRRVGADGKTRFIRFTRETH